jgi:uncharacterized protein
MASFREKLARLSAPRGQTADLPRAGGSQDLTGIRTALERALGRSVTPATRPEPSQLPFAVEMTEDGPLCTRRLTFETTHEVGTVGLGSALTADEATLSLLSLTPALANCDIGRALYLDTETSGLGSGTANVPFLVGLAWCEQDARGSRAVVEQLFLRDRDDERPLLEWLRRRLQAASMVVTYNGKSFDMPVLRARYVMNALEPPPERDHLDLLHLARRVHRHRTWSKSLGVLEREVLRFRRGPDIAGEEVAERYRHFMRSGDEQGLQAVVDHNEHDVLSLLALVGLYGEPLRSLPATELASVARVMRRAGALERAENVASLALERGAGAIGLRARADIAKARGDKEQALADFEALAATVADPTVRLELAKLYEHYRRDPDRALAMVDRGTSETAERSDHRRRRLLRKRARVANGPEIVASSQVDGVEPAKRGA